MLNTRLTLEQRQERLQAEYDNVCNMLIYCSMHGEAEGCKEYLWRKHELELVADSIGIELLKERDTKKLIDFAKRQSVETV